MSEQSKTEFPNGVTLVEYLMEVTPDGEDGESIMVDLRMGVTEGLDNILEMNEEQKEKFYEAANNLHQCIYDVLNEIGSGQ